MFLPKIYIVFFLTFLINYVNCICLLKFLNLKFKVIMYCINLKFQNLNIQKFLFFYFITVLFVVVTTLFVIIRIELSNLGNVIFQCNSQFYIVMLTVYSLLMVFLVVMPILIGGLGNFFFPFLIGAPVALLAVVKCGYLAMVKRGYLAQLVEHWTFNPLVWSSILQVLITLKLNFIFYFVLDIYINNIIIIK